MTVCKLVAFQNTLHQWDSSLVLKSWAQKTFFFFLWPGKVCMLLLYGFKGVFNQLKEFCYQRQGNTDTGSYFFFQSSYLPPPTPLFFFTCPLKNDRVIYHCDNRDCKYCPHLSRDAESSVSGSETSIRKLGS